MIRARIAAALAAVLAIGVCLAVTSADAATPETLFGTTVPAVKADADTGAVELGVQFRPAVDGTVSGVRFYKGTGNTGTHSGSVWSSTGSRLVTGTFTGESSSGWQSLTFGTPLAVTAGSTYTASYFAPRSHYAVNNPYAWPRVSGNLTGVKGVYRYGSTSGFPSSVYQTSNYWVDVTFTANVVAPPTTTSPVTSTPVSTTPPTTNASTTTTTTTTTPPTGSIGRGWTLTAAKVGLTPFGLTCADLPEYQLAGNTVPAGTTIYRHRITGWLDLSMGNITISQSCIQPVPGAVGQGSDSLTTWNSQRELQGPVTIQDSEYDGSLLSAHDQAFIGFFVGVANFYRNYVHNSGSGFSTYVSWERTDSNVTIENNYVDRLIAYGDPTNGGNHQSGYTVRDFVTDTNPNRQLIVDDNYFNCDGANATGAFFIQPNDANVANVTVSGNLLAGNGYQLILEDDQGRFPGVTYHNMRAMNNRMLNTEYGPALVAGTGEGWAQWDHNFLYDATAVDGQGALVPTP